MSARNLVTYDPSSRQRRRGDFWLFVLSLFLIGVIVGFLAADPLKSLAPTPPPTVTPTATVTHTPTFTPSPVPTATPLPTQTPFIITATPSPVPTWDNTLANVCDATVFTDNAPARWIPDNGARIRRTAQRGQDVGIIGRPSSGWPNQGFLQILFQWPPTQPTDIYWMRREDLQLSATDSDCDSIPEVPIG